LAALKPADALGGRIAIDSERPPSRLEAHSGVVQSFGFLGDPLIERRRIG
jgi:hypothetical protein